MSIYLIILVIWIMLFLLGLYYRIRLAFEILQENYGCQLGMLAEKVKYTRLSLYERIMALGYKIKDWSA